MFKQAVAALCVAGAMACASQAQALVLYDNFSSGGPASSAANIFNDRQANSFTLAANATITGLDFQVWMEDQGATLSSFQWGIYSASPFSGGVLLGGATVQGPTQSGPLANPYGVNERLITLGTAPLALAAGTYWLEVGQAAGSTGRGYWEVSHGPSTALQAPGGVNCGQDCVDAPSNSFRLLGDITAGPISAAVPEPATWAMLILGFMSVGAMVRRQRAHLALSHAA